ncbi:malonic semialdehyde reductase [Temperatibacter marinus]|uniref:Putative NADH dehydrogenase/NAD(P)H nitroreductase QGN29_07150 n=1 Tax=Temperatibacter marinus TaxID=1456591 RepID=A0AA52HBY9_9PROT|nr:malonic semialdehyde reductase [Temperatibacter marinus]WND04148.1 malonic semialdehyde reductase [Temperatibacter marinus]
MTELSQASLDQLFMSARSMNGWHDTPIALEKIHKLYDLVKLAPTSANCSPARFVFVQSLEKKKLLADCAMEGNKAKILAAPVTVIIGHDMNFATNLPKLFPHDSTAPSWFEDRNVKELTAFRNGTLQGGYLMLAARALGLDCGPMSGFDNTMVDSLFFEGTEIRSNFICGLGYGDPASLFPRSPRLDFAEAASLV